jgi:catalase
MAIRIATPDGEEWRSGMNDSPVFAVATPEAFYEQAQAQRIDPATGKPDPAALQRFAAAHPETAGFAQWARTAPWTASYAEASYNSLNAFRLVDANGKTRTVRWSMRTAEPTHDIAQADLAQRGPDYLAQDLKDRLRQGPLRWHLVVTLAAPGDPSDDATKAWPEERERVDVGTLIVEQAQDEASGPCRDLNYDPTILPDGIERSDDPLLVARSAAYANSFDRRTAELARLAAAAYAAGERP